MAQDSRSEREKMKEEYKTHYRKMREAKERFNRNIKTHNITQALKNMDTSELMERFDSFLGDIKSKIAHAEARLDVALDNLDRSKGSDIFDSEQEEAFSNHRAHETLEQLKMEMGQLYREIEHQAASMEVDKTIGRSAPEQTVPPGSSNKMEQL